MNQNIRIMLVEDHAGYRETIATALELEDNMELVGQYGTAEIALRKLQSSTESELPDVILLDLNLPGFHGLEAMPWISQYAPKAKTIVLTQSDNVPDINRAITQGAAGYLLKSATLREIIDAIQTVVDGGASLDPDVARYILNSFQTPKNNAEQPDKGLSQRELETLELIGQGLAKKEIADKLDISITTVAYHVKHIYEKLNVANAPAAVDRAHRLGIL